MVLLDNPTPDAALVIAGGIPMVLVWIALTLYYRYMARHMVAADFSTIATESGSGEQGRIALQSGGGGGSTAAAASRPKLLIPIEEGRYEMMKQQPPQPPLLQSGGGEGPLAPSTAGSASRPTKYLGSSVSSSSAYDAPLLANEIQYSSSSEMTTTTLSPLTMGMPPLPQQGRGSVGALNDTTGTTSMPTVDRQRELLARFDVAAGAAPSSNNKNDDMASMSNPRVGPTVTAGPRSSGPLFATPTL